MEESNKKIIVLHSGGMDSTVCLLSAVSEGYHVISLGFDYGQRHKVELEYANYQCQKFGIDRRIIKLEWDKPKRDMPLDRGIDEIKSGISTAFLPGRNLIFFSIACAEAAGIGAQEVWSGVNAVDFSGYPDCTPAFVKSFEQTLSYAIPGGPKLCAPILNYKKKEIASLAKKLGIGKGDTWSCYRPMFNSIGIMPCQSCDACILHEFAWQGI